MIEYKVEYESVDGVTHIKEHMTYEEAQARFDELRMVIPPLAVGGSFGVNQMKENNSLLDSRISSWNHGVENIFFLLLMQCTQER